MARMRVKVLRSKVLMLIFLGVMICSGLAVSEDFSHIKDLFSVRTAISDQGQGLPDKIRNTSGEDLRTLEKIFELNTSVLTTIEAYFRIFKIAYTRDGRLNRETLKSVNDWLKFIGTQCQYDIEFLNSAESETEDAGVRGVITTAKDNLFKLSEVTKNGVIENVQMTSGANR